ncbi:hypothetical protein GWK47_000159 [Chionoecetes opilio]|uniref:Uncharacterized protein n=1 Tax=Chionoecetes opilio TaxID=41210 RepID=A0A8J4XRP9_CHIOP|nr:hypothetical protein GWK47_000159 [Chionoecetes opilio]
MVHRKSVKEAAPSSPRKVAVVWEESTDPTQKKSRCVGEEIPRCTASWQNLNRSRKRRAEESPEFSLGADDAFSTSGTRTPSTHTVDEDRQFLRASAARMDPAASCKRMSRQSLADRERDGVWSCAC